MGFMNLTRTNLVADIARRMSASVTSRTLLELSTHACGVCSAQFILSPSLQVSDAISPGLDESDNYLEMECGRS